ncbi:TonB-dependent receptor [Prosthecobacter dejongeii]|uniref:Catecholate siderophore receptor n=1 Tax=Prosthecobacter dejongeii TaxID=48465 RepID=A0A7W8DRQ3_9BACT|nr:TonB-dependent siderophore receptor [Prosthecobacter dejongeii]MBB5039530.1 catecholate siderophore receptor [Prosthecobacter dejongeii]
MKLTHSPFRTLPHGFAWTSTLGLLGSLAAQTAAPTPAVNPATEGEPTDELPEIVVTTTSEKVYKPERLQSPKYTEPLRDVPQTITVIPKAVIEDRGAFSLRDVLRNTPGISMQAGEGGGGLSGDNLSIRGFTSRGDLYQDGVRDTGSYNRDPFNTEQVEVTKGPSSSSNGRGSTGGSINLTSKLANQEQGGSVSQSFGTDNLYRTTADYNQPISDHMALRVNGMYHSADTPGRDVVNQERYGLAASLAFGLGTETRAYINYQHLSENNIPDYGIPWVPANGTFSGSGTRLNNYKDKAPPVSFDNFYGRENTDFEDVQSDIITGILEHDFSDKLKLRNVLRYGRVYRNSVITAPRFFDTVPTAQIPDPANPGQFINDPATVGNQYTSALNRQMQAREQTQEILSNQTNFTAEFDTGILKHALVTGMELTWERQVNANAARADAAGRSDIFNPGLNDGVYTGRPVLPGGAESHLDTFSLYAFDTISIAKYVELNGGLRYDHLEYESRNPGGSAGFSGSDDLISWKAGIVVKPVEYGSIYFSYGTSFNPSIDTNVGLGLTAAVADLNPEENRSYELGTKWDLFDERLSLTAALFRSEKTNARTNDPILGTVLAGDQVVQGVEFGLAGNITKDWQVFAGYAYMESEVRDSAVVAELGQSLGNTPDHSFNIWTTYNLPFRVQVGFGAQYVGDRQNGNSNTSRTAPGYWTCDAMLNYQVNDKFNVRLNVYNLADERYIDRVGGGHFVPGAGRSAALTASYKF